MKIRDLSQEQLLGSLGRSGLFLETGPFILKIQSVHRGFAGDLGSLYADFRVIDNVDFSDYNIRLDAPNRLRRLLRPQVSFFLDNHSPFFPMPAHLSFQVFEWGVNWCISRHANQFLIIHSAVLERDGRSVLLTAAPGGGKSTLCAALAHRGWRLFSDELALIRPDNGKVIPMPRPVALKNASIQLIRNFEPQAQLGPTRENAENGTIAHMRPPTDSVSRSTETADPGLVIFVAYKEGAALSVDSLPKSRAFLRLAQNALNYSLLGKIAFETLAGFIDASTCHELRYSQLNDAIEAIDSLCQ